MMFEVETLVNASTAIISRAGIICVSDTDLDLAPVIEVRVRKRPDTKRHAVLQDLISRWIGKCTRTDPGECFQFLSRCCLEVMKKGRVGRFASFAQLFEGLTERAVALQRLVVVMATAMSRPTWKRSSCCLCWSVGALLEADDRLKLDE